jgi:hypothetical protein
MTSCLSELRLADMLADPIVKAVIEADGIDLRELEAELRHAAALLRTTRRTRTRITEPHQRRDRH